MFSAFNTFGKLGALASSVARAWSPLALWPDGIATPGMWISPRDLTSQWQDYTGTTPVSVPGTVADSSNPVGLALDIRAGATVLTDPGNHMLRSTSVDRPLLTARTNLLTYTEDLTNAAWFSTASGSTITTGVTDPLGGTTAFTITANIPNGQAYQNLNALTAPRIASGYIRRRTGVGTVMFYADSGMAGEDITSEVTSEWSPFSVTSSTSSGSWYVLLQTSGDAVDVFHPQVEIGPIATAYQPILTDGSSYASGPPIAQLYNGTNSGMATAAFAAGTLIDGMDCLIAVRRDSAAATYLISNTGSRGFFEWESGGTSRPDVSAGTPTYYVDGVACTATRGALFTALTAGDWHILEARGLDLSTWTAFDVSKLASYCLNGARGDILLYPSTTPTADKDAARQWLADYYGVTLP